MRRASCVDENQKEIVAGLRELGASVCTMNAVGDGCPDIAVGWQNLNYFFELKDEDKTPSQQKLTPDQVKWHAAWKGQVAVVKSLAEALNVMRRQP